MNLGVLSPPTYFQNPIQRCSICYRNYNPVLRAVLWYATPAGVLCSTGMDLDDLRNPYASKPAAPVLDVCLPNSDIRYAQIARPIIQEKISTVLCRKNRMDQQFILESHEHLGPPNYDRRIFVSRTYGDSVNPLSKVLKAVACDIA